MSLLIVGSCSRVTSNIIHTLSKNQQYTKITIADLLPLYPFHHRYYRLRKELDASSSSTTVNITKLFEKNQLFKFVA